MKILNETDVVDFVKMAVVLYWRIGLYCISQVESQRDTDQSIVSKV